MKIFSFIITLFFVSFISKAQFQENIASGRPGQSTGPFTLGKNVFQGQHGITALKAYSDFYNLQGLTFNNFFRFGITEKMEVGFSQSYAMFELDTIRNNGFSGGGLTFRHNIIESKSNLPSFGYQVGIGMPFFFSNDFSFSKTFSANIKTMFSHAFKNSSLYYNLGLRTDGSSANVYYTLGYSWGDKISPFIETFGNSRYYRNWGNINGGLGYRVNSNLKLDATVGVTGLFQSFDVRPFISAGISWRVHNR